MRRWLLLLLLAAAPSLAAQPSFGEPFPLTNTRYDVSHGQSRLVAHGDDFFLFWHDWRSGAIRMTKVADGEPRTGVAIARTSFSSAQGFDVVSTGTDLLLAWIREDRGGVYTQRFDREGAPLSAAVKVLDAAPGVHLAIGGGSVLLLGGEGATVALDLRGLRRGAPMTGIGEGVPLAAAASNHGFAGILWVASTELSLVLFDRDAKPVSRRVLAAKSGFRAEAALAGHDDDGYFLVHCDGPCFATALDATGATIGSQQLDTPDRSELTLREPAAVRHGGEWIAAYIKNSGSGVYRARFATLDAEARAIVSRQETAGYDSLSLAAGRGGVKAAWQPLFQAPISAAALPLGDEPPRAVSFAPAIQRLHATATSRDATLVVWSELVNGGTGVYAGVRRRSGEWIERELASSPYESYRTIRAQSDGRGFLISMHTWSKSSAVAIALDSYGWRRWTVPLDFLPNDIAWNGREYALIGQADAPPWTVTLMTLSPAGKTSARIDSHSLNAPSLHIASDGFGFLAAGGGGCIVPPCSTGANAIRLGPDLQRTDDVVFDLVDDVWQVSPHAIWDGTEYLVFLQHFGALEVARIPPAVREPVTSILTRKTATYPEPVRFPDGIAVLLYGESVAVISRGELAYTIPHNLPDNALLATLADDRLATLHVALPPSLRIMMTIADSPRPQRPEPPRIGVTADTNGRPLIFWNSPPAGGYRLEYRAGDAPWKELERFIRGDERWTTFEGEGNQFRMRAIGDGGISDYSNVAVIDPALRPPD